MAPTISRRMESKSSDTPPFNSIESRGVTLDEVLETSKQTTKTMFVCGGTSNATLCLVFSFWYIVALVNAADCPVFSANSHQEFADHLTTELYLMNGNEDNVNQCSSALGVSLAFSLIYPSAIGDAEMQIRKVFGYPTESQKTLVWDEVATRLDDTYEGRCPGEDQFPDECFLTEPAVEIANRIWVREGVGLDSSYMAIVGDLAQEMDFSSDQAGNTINTWASENTNGLIDQIVQDGPLPADWLLVATNSLYMKASWLWQFQEFRTSQDNFYLSSGEISNNQAHFMHMVEHFEYSHDALGGFQVIRLPFAGDGASNGLSMVFVMPISTEDGVANGIASSVDVIEALPKLERTKIALSIPKFKYESSYQSDLMDSLKTIGVVAPFSGGLCVMDGDCSSAIDVVIQKTVIDVNEKGVEAAAVTLVGVATSLPPPEPVTLFSADHPFQFFIHDSNENIILFEGIVKDPSIPE